MGVADQSPLGRHSDYVDHYDASLLFAVPRSEARSSLGIQGVLPFVGVDIWNAYELSWLTNKGKPQVALAEIRVPCDSASLVESKSLKLYLNSFANSRFVDADQVSSRIAEDLVNLLNAPVAVELRALNTTFAAVPAGLCIDDQDLELADVEVGADVLRAGSEHKAERLYSNLLRSRCPVTGQPDWATLSVEYQGHAIDPAGLLRYLVSFRNHQGFHEQVVERIFVDIQQRCRPDKLIVYGRFTRRGGIDINPWRSSDIARPVNWREPRQ